MESKTSNIHKTIIFVAIFVVGLFAGYSLGVSYGLELKEVVEDNRKNTDVSVMFDYGNGDIDTFTDLPKYDNESIFMLIERVTTDQNIPIKFTDYGGELGAFIESINNVGPDPNGEKWWQYWVNNEYSKVGVSSYTVSAGDVIQFKFIGDHE